MKQSQPVDSRGRKDGNSKLFALSRPLSNDKQLTSTGTNPTSRVSQPQNPLPLEMSIARCWAIRPQIYNFHQLFGVRYSPKNV